MKKLLASMLAALMLLAAVPQCFADKYDVPADVNDIVVCSDDHIKGPVEE